MQNTEYATDEDLALRIHSDFSLICPGDQKLAESDDGVILASDRWKLSSASVDFLAQGVQSGHVVHLRRPLAAFRPPGDYFGVESVDASGIRLRRKGQPRDQGQPPVSAAGLSGIEFSIVSLRPQIEVASYELERRFGLALAPTGRASLIDQRELREAVILSVLQRRYLELSRENGPQRDSFASKSAALKSELDELLARLTLHIQSTGSTQPETLTRFHTRLSR